MSHADTKEKMVANKYPAFRNFVVAVYSIYFYSLPTPIVAVLMKVHDPYLDIALLYDQSYSMTPYLNATIWDDMSEWIRNYFKGSGANQTQFAVLACELNSRSVPVLYFNNTFRDEAITFNSDKAQMVIDAQNYVKSQFGQNRHMVPPCLRSTWLELFHQKKGDRPDAKNVVLRKLLDVLIQLRPVYYTISLINK